MYRKRGNDYKWDKDMTSRERVLQTIHGKKADRVPLNVFAGWNPGVRKKVNAKYGDVETFCKQYNIDIMSGFLPRFPFGRPEDQTEPQNLDRYLQMEPVLDSSSPGILDMHCDGDLFYSATEVLEFQKQDLATFINVWGIFELSQFFWEKNGIPGTQEALMHMIAEKEKMKMMFFKLAEWTAAAAENACRAGVDVIEFSDDWGQQNTMLFSPDMWWEMIYPAAKIVVDRIKSYDVPVLLHSDGDVSMVLDGIKKLGINALHPVQESAGMSFEKTRAVLGQKMCIMGGLDTVTALPAMDEDEIRVEVKRIFDQLKHSGPYIFSGSHMFQDDTRLEVIEAAYETANKHAAFNLT
jgi:uroporphyrinogen decarboxylase